MPREWLIQHRAGTLAEWAAAEASGPVLLAGERAYITDLKLDVVGDGVTKVASLGAAGSGTYARRLPDGAGRTAASIPRATEAFPTLTSTIPLIGGTNTVTPSTGTNWAITADNAGATQWHGPAGAATSSYGGVPACLQATGDTYPSPLWLEFVTDAPLLSLYGAWGASYFILYVDDELVTRTPRNVSGNYLTVDWGGVRKLRHYKWYAAAGFGPAAVRTGTGDTVYRPPGLKRKPLIGWLADSYGQTGNSPLAGYLPSGIPYGVSMMLGWRLRLSSEGGTGWNSSGPTNSFDYRLPQYFTGLPLDGFVFAGGINDSVGTLEARATSTLATARSMFPSAPFWVVGPWSPSSTWETTNAAKWTALQNAAAATSNCTFIDNRGWITGTGKVGATTGDGNADQYISNDGTHLYASVGDNYTASRMSRAIITAWGL